MFSKLFKFYRTVETFVVNGKDNFPLVQEKVIEIVNREEKKTRELYVFIADEIFCKKFGSGWLDFLLEKRLFSTRSGGRDFYVRLSQYKTEHDFTFCKLYLLALKLGFRGEKNEFPFKEYGEVRDLIFLNPLNELGQSSYRRKPLSESNSIWYVVFFLVLWYLSVFGYESFKIVSLSKKILTVTSGLK